MFGSVIGHWSDELKDMERHPHDFIDDLESFYWTYLWIIMMHNGPGPGARLAKSNTFVRKWTVGVNDPDMLWAPKSRYLSQLFPTNFITVAPYFSDSPYILLAEDLRKLFSSYYNENCSERRTLENLFPQMDDIYAQVLTFFDKAIEHLGGAPDIVKNPSPPISTNTSQLETGLLQPLRRIQAYRHGKRACEDDQPSDPRAKRKKAAYSESQLDTSKSDKIAPSNSNRHRVVQEGIRRSERIRELKKKGNSLLVVGDGSTMKASRRR